MKFKSILAKCVCVCLFVVFSFTLIACNVETMQGQNAQPLSVPTNVRVEDGILKWNPVEQAVGYTVEILSSSSATIRRTIPKRRRV